MPRASRTTDILVGAFVVLGAITVVGASLWARQTRVGAPRSGLTARFHDVGNAGVGTGVFIRGVRAGRVAALELGDDGWVRMRLTLDPKARLPEDPVVVLGASTLFGEWQATVTSRGTAVEQPDVARQLADAEGETGVLPGATLPDVAQLTAVAGRIANDVGAVAGRVRVAFDDSAARELRATIANVSALSATLTTLVRGQSSAVARVSGDLQAGTRSLALSSEAMRRTLERTDSLTTALAASGAVPSTARDVAAGAADLRASAAEVREIARRTAETQRAIDRLVLHADSVLGRLDRSDGTLGRLIADPSLYRNTDSLVVELRALVGDLRAHPKRYVNVRLF